MRLRPPQLTRPEDFVFRRQRPPPQNGVMTMPKLLALIRAGYGQGHLHDYKPWLRVTKKDFSSESNIGHHQSREFGHMHHFRSIAERSMIILLKFLGAWDVRDQYPAWPWPHAHPLTGLPDSHDLPKVRGLTDIAAEANIRHGVYAGSKPAIPYVATIDMLSTWWCEKTHRFHLIVHDCKPERKVLQAKIGSQMKARLELIRRYCVETGIHYALTHPEKIPELLVTNLHALHPRGLSADQQQQLRQSASYLRTVDHCMRWAYQQPATTTASQVAAKDGHDIQSVLGIVRLAIWFQDLDHDLSKSFELYEPLIPGGQALKGQMGKLFCAWAP